VSEQQELPDDVTAAEAQIEALIAELGPDKARETLELLLTELVVSQDPESKS
jgi:hypothetical protein